MEGFSSILIVMIFLMLLGFGAIISKFNLKIRSLLPLIFLPILLYWVYLESSYLVRVLEGAELLDDKRLKVGRELSSFWRYVSVKGREG